MINCPSCSTANKDEQSVCWRCGTAIGSAAVAPPAVIMAAGGMKPPVEKTVVGAPRSTPSARPAPTRTVRWPSFVVIGLLAAILLVLLLRRP